MQQNKTGGYAPFFLSARVVLLLIFSCFFSITRPADFFQFTTRVQTAYTSLLNLHTAEADSLLEAEKKQNPGNFLPFILQNHCDFVNTLISGNPDDYKNLRKRADARLLLISSIEEDSPYLLFYSAELNMHLAIAAYSFREFKTAALDMNAAYRDIRKNEKRYPDFILNKKWIGVLHAMYGVIPEEYSFIKWIMGYSGSVKQGMTELNETIRNIRNTKTFTEQIPEIQFFLVSIVTHVIDDINQATKLKAQFSASPTSATVVSEYNRLSLAVYLGDHDLLPAFFQRIDSLSGGREIPFLYYLRGHALLNAQNPDCVKYLMQFVSKYAG
ncbi:MAG: hypothetical protein KKA07_15955, partial [Bacteroidetes bacterium]|nr:hypothetical protein [Bacteroidota bacterium]